MVATLAGKSGKAGIPFWAGNVFIKLCINLMMNVISPFASCTILVDWGNSVCDCSGFNLEWMPVVSAGFLCFL